MAIRNLLYKTEYPINDNISIKIPTVGEIIDNEDNYYGVVSVFTVMPMDMMVQLDDAGIDFTTINEYDLFLMLFNGLKTMDVSLVLGDLDLSKFDFAVNQKNQEVVLLDSENDIVIDKAIYLQISDTLRAIHHLEKNIKKPANSEATAFLLERARKKLRRRKNQKEDSQLESLIISMVNTEQYKYNFEETRSLSIYQFNESARQIINKINFDNKMIGVYTGSINAKELKQDELSWLKQNK